MSNQTELMLDLMQEGMGQNHHQDLMKVMGQIAENSGSVALLVVGIVSIIGCIGFGYCIMRFCFDDGESDNDNNWEKGYGSKGSDETNEQIPEEKSKKSLSEVWKNFKEKKFWESEKEREFELNPVEDLESNKAKNLLEKHQGFAYENEVVKDEEVSDINEVTEEVNEFAKDHEGKEVKDCLDYANDCLNFANECLAYVNQAAIVEEEANVLEVNIPRTEISTESEALRENNSIGFSESEISEIMVEVHKKFEEETNDKYWGKSLYCPSDYQDESDYKSLDKPDEDKSLRKILRIEDESVRKIQIIDDDSSEDEFVSFIEKEDDDYESPSKKIKMDLDHEIVKFEKSQEEPAILILEYSDPQWV